MPLLGGAEAVEELDAEGLVPALAQRHGEGLAGGGREAQARRGPAPPLRGGSTICWIIVGTLTSTVGRWRAIAAKTLSAVAFSGKRQAEAPTEKGKKRFEPMRIAEEELRHGERDVVCGEAEKSAGRRPAW